MLAIFKRGGKELELRKWRLGSRWVHVSAQIMGGGEQRSSAPPHLAALPTAILAKAEVHKARPLFACFSFFV